MSFSFWIELEVGFDPGLAIDDLVVGDDRFVLQGSGDFLVSLLYGDMLIKLDLELGELLPCLSLACQAENHQCQDVLL